MHPSTLRRRLLNRRGNIAGAIHYLYEPHLRDIPAAHADPIAVSLDPRGLGSVTLATFVGHRQRFHSPRARPGLEPTAPADLRPKRGPGCQFGRDARLGCHGLQSRHRRQREGTIRGAALQHGNWRVDGSDRGGPIGPDSDRSRERYRHQIPGSSRGQVVGIFGTGW